jgi:hypothetical protein
MEDRLQHKPTAHELQTGSRQPSLQPAPTGAKPRTDSTYNGGQIGGEVNKISNVRALTISPAVDWPLQRRLEYLEWAREVSRKCEVRRLGWNSNSMQRLNAVRSPNSRLLTTMGLFPIFTDFSPVRQTSAKVYVSEIFITFNSKNEQWTSGMPDRGEVDTVVLDHLHCRAICDEIGDRLRYALAREHSEIPPRLIALIGKLALLDQTPSIVPSTEEMSSPWHLGYPSSKPSGDPVLPATNRKSTSAAALVEP